MHGDIFEMMSSKYFYLPNDRKL